MKFHGNLNLDIHTYPLLVEIEDLQVKEFARNYNSPLTNLRDLFLVQVRLFGPPRIGVSLSFVISISREGLGDISTPNSAMVSIGVSPSPVSGPWMNASTTPVVSLYFNSSTLVSPSARVANPSTP